MKHLNHFLVLILLLFIAFSSIACTSPSVNSSTNPPTTIAPVEPSETTMPEPTFPNPPELDYSFEYIPNLSREDNIIYRCRIEGYLINLFSILADMDIRDPEYLEKTEPITALIQELQALDQRYLEDYLAIEAERERWEAKKAEYPVATEVWLYMKNEFGWSDIVCAGIMGNMMAECGGCWTSDLNWDINTSSGLGMIQWIGGRRKEIISIYGENPSIEEQLLFMRDELYGTNGVTKQVQDWQLEKIMNAETPEDCAYYFAHYFERCSDKHKPPRRDYARRAYNYFVIE